MDKESNNKEIAIIVGAGPAGLTAAYELLIRTDIKPIIFEKDPQYVGGISRTTVYKGNRIDIGGHRFFSKSDRVMKWWQNILPLKNDGDNHDTMLERNRLSRIYYLRSFFDYPVKLNANTIKNLGLVRIIKIGLSYMRAKLSIVKREINLEDFFINRFGKELYKTFFRDYTQKVWGVPCRDIPAEWGAQRIKGLSISRVFFHALKTLFSKNKTDISQKKIETSLIEKFLYPKYGPGQMWEKVASQITQLGGEIHMNTEVVGFMCNDSGDLQKIKVKNRTDNTKKEYGGNIFFSTMPVKDLIKAFQWDIPDDVKQVAKNLVYRDFITVGLLLSKFKINKKNNNEKINDNWIYIQEPDVKVGRVQIFNNWSPYLVSQSEKTWIGLEYFVNEGDEIWTMSDEILKKFAVSELEKIDFIDAGDVDDAVVIRMPKAYPAYFGSYVYFDKIRKFVDNIDNLFLLGRNGMHRYNNQDHSMLTAMIAVDNIVAGIKDKDNVWSVNTEEEYHEKVNKK